MNGNNWLENYFDHFKKSLLNEEVMAQLTAVRDCFAQVKRNGKKIIIAGNGGSASIASHAVLDLSNKAGLRAICFNDPGIITCWANDFGYEQWPGRGITLHADAGDCAVLISSSGKSGNMIHAAKVARSKGATVVTLSGFAADNPLRKAGDINLWVASSNYNTVENTHQVWLLAISDWLA